MTQPLDRPESVREGHTPGPWIVFHCDGVFAVLPAMRRGEIARVVDQGGPETTGATADLLAAAPDLLAALQGVVRVADRKTTEFDAARAAISKALGGENG